MEKFNYDNIFLVGEIQNKELLFMEIDVDNFSFKYITAQKFTVNFEEIKEKIKNLDKEKICNIIDLLEEDGLKSIYDGGDLGNNILSEIYRKFFLYTIDEDNINVFIKTDTFTFPKIEYYDKIAFNSILEALNSKNDDFLNRLIDLNTVFDDIGSFYSLGEKEITENKKDDFLTAFSRLLNDYNIKF